MEWIDVEKELPKSRKRYLGLCRRSFDDDSWHGIVDVFFDPHFGWGRCEKQDLTHVFVIAYTEHPCPNYPFEEKNNA